MTTTRLRRTTLNTATSQEVALHRIGWSATGAVANPYLPWDTPKAIKDAMVLYYDIAKQKATNKSMAVNPTLKDLSGNGNDATCYNFAWSGMSGIGGYDTPNLVNWQINDLTAIINTINENKLEIISARILEQVIRYTFTKGVRKLRLKITLASPEKKVRIGFDNAKVQDITEDGIYEFKFMYSETQDNTINIGTLGGVTIEQLPLYPNALVSDGVNDYCIVWDRYDDEGNLINKKSLVLNKEDGYTIIAKRKWLDTNNNNINNTFVSKGIASGIKIETRLFSNNSMYTISFGATTNIQKELSDFIYQTTNSYCGIGITSGDKLDEPMVVLFDNKKAGGWYSSIALYSLIIFNRDLTTDEIEWVKNNLMQ